MRIHALLAFAALTLAADEALNTETTLNAQEIAASSDSKDTTDTTDSQDAHGNSIDPASLFSIPVPADPLDIQDTSIYDYDSALFVDNPVEGYQCPRFGHSPNSLWPGKRDDMDGRTACRLQGLSPPHGRKKGKKFKKWEAECMGWRRAVWEHWKKCEHEAIKGGSVRRCCDGWRWTPDVQDGGGNRIL